MDGVSQGLGTRRPERRNGQPDNHATPHAADGEKLHLTSQQVFHEPLLAARYREPQQGPGSSEHSREPIVSPP